MIRKLIIMKQLVKDNQVIWYDEARLQDPAESCCDAHYWQQAGKIVGAATGRGTTWFVDAGYANGEPQQAALRHYRRGGLFGKVVRDHYFFSSWEKTRSYQEFLLLQQLRQAGVNVPRPIAARAIKRTWCYQADLLSEKIPNARDLVAILQEKPLSAEIYQKIKVEIDKMHQAQVNHTDLNIHNILVDDKERVWIIDFDKCYQQSGDSWKAKNIARLKRSFEKERVKRNIHWDESDWCF